MSNSTDGKERTIPSIGEANYQDNHTYNYINKRGKKLDNHIKFYIQL